MTPDATRWEHRENSPWLRWVFFAGSLGMGILLYRALAADEPDFVRAACIAAGVLLLGFSGVVVQERRIVVDPARRSIVIESRRLRRRSRDSIAFDELRKIQIVATPTTREDSGGRTLPDTDWFVALVLDGRTLSVNQNPCNSPDQARALALEIARRTGLALDEGGDGSVDALVRQGRKIEAISALARQQGLSLSDARAEIERRIALANTPIR